MNVVDRNESQQIKTTSSPHNIQTKGIKESTSKKNTSQLTSLIILQKENVNPKSARDTIP